MMRTATLALLIAVVLAVAWRWGSFVAGGSDSSCYATQAVRWANLLSHPRTASLQAPDALALAAPWPDATATFTPTGHVASTTVPGAFVPICPSGLSILMAPLFLLGGPSLMFAIVPLLGAVLVLATHALGANVGQRTGVAAAALTAFSPVFLYQVVQPMSDIPAAAFWIVAIACATGTRRHSVAFAGLATSLAVLVRPNLVPLGFVIGAFLLVRPERAWSQRWRSALVYALWSAPGCFAVAGLQQYFYGSPLASGYGDADVMFSATHVMPNLTRYATWLWSTQTPIVMLALVAPFLLPGWLTMLLISLAITNVLLYLPYVVFNDWSFLRFLLPTVPVLMVLVAAVVDSVAVRMLRSGYSPGDPRTGRRPTAILAVVTVVIIALFVQQARARHAFDLHAMESRFASGGRVVAEKLPTNAIVITDYESGSVPFYSGRRTLAWRSLDPLWLDRAVTFVRDHGFEPYLLFERWEEPEFRSRFARSPLGALDWPPMAEVAAQVRIYRVADRDRYRNGESVPTEYVR